MIPAAKLGQIARRAVEEIVPRCCVFCGLPSLPDEVAICEGCAADLPWIRRPCPVCAMPVTANLPIELTCGECQVNPPPFDRIVAPLEYAYPVDVAIKAFKFDRKLYYQPAFAEILCGVLPRLPRDVDSVLPVPLHRWRQLRRGFNQAFELARPIAKQLSLPLITNVVRRVATPYQSGLTAEERQRNLDNAFAVRGKVRSEHVLLVDDVITTGATCRKLASLLRGRGVGRVSALAISRALRPSG